MLKNLGTAQLLANGDLTDIHFLLSIAKGLLNDSDIPNKSTKTIRFRRLTRIGSGGQEDRRRDPEKNSNLSLYTY